VPECSRPNTHINVMTIHLQSGRVERQQFHPQAGGSVGRLLRECRPAAVAVVPNQLGRPAAAFGK